MEAAPGVREETVVSSRVIGIVLVVGGLLLVFGCAHKRVTGRPVTEPATTEPDEPSPTAPETSVDTGAAVKQGVHVATLAQEQVGRPYRWGGENPSYGFDCSGLVQWCYGSVGVSLPRVVREQRKVGKSITGDRLRPGDLVFFALDGNSTSHVGVYIGGRRFVHAPRAGQPVRVNSLDDSWWRERWKDSRRVLEG